MNKQKFIELVYKNVATWASTDQDKQSNNLIGYCYDVLDDSKELSSVSEALAATKQELIEADEMYEANYEKIKAAEDERLRLKIVSMTFFSLEEADFAYQFVKGNNNTLSELKEFRQWKEEKAKKAFESTL